MESCSADFGQELLTPESEAGRQGKRRKERTREARRGGSRTQGPEKSDDASHELNEGAAAVNKKYYSVKCDVCCTPVAVYDQDEVYHFFNVLASHS